MKKGFALPEALMTLTIIGVVAAFTVPSLNYAMTDMENKVKAKKAFQVLSNAMGMISLKGYVAKYNAVDGDTNNIKNWFNNYLEPNLTYTKVCYDGKDCWHKGHTYGLNKDLVYASKDGAIGNGIVKVILNDGTYLNIDAYSSSDISSYFGVDITSSAGIVVYFDINGEKGPNVLGRDIYVAVYYGDTFVPAYRDRTQSQIDSNCSDSGAGYSCLQKIITQS